MNRDPRRVLDQVVRAARARAGRQSADRRHGQAIFRRLGRVPEPRHHPSPGRTARLPLFGIGAAWLGFIRPQAPGADEARRLVADLTSCDVQDDEQGEAAGLARTGRGRRQQVLLLGYAGFRGDPGIATQMGKRRTTGVGLDPWRAARTVQRRRQPMRSNHLFISYLSNTYLWFEIFTPTRRRFHGCADAPFSWPLATTDAASGFTMAAPARRRSAFLRDSSMSANASTLPLPSARPRANRPVDRAGWSPALSI